MICYGITITITMYLHAIYIKKYNPYNCHVGGDDLNLPHTIMTPVPVNNRIDYKS